MVEKLFWFTFFLAPTHNIPAIHYSCPWWRKHPKIAAWPPVLTSHGHWGSVSEALSGYMRWSLWLMYELNPRKAGVFLFGGAWSPAGGVIWESSGNIRLWDLFGGGNSPSCCLFSTLFFHSTIRWKDPPLQASPPMLSCLDAVDQETMDWTLWNSKVKISLAYFQVIFLGIWVAAMESN